MKSVVLFSGGLDSAVCVAQELAAGRDVLALGFDYGQTNEKELVAARQMSSYWGFPYYIAECPMFGAMDPRKEIPGRNTVFLAKGLEYALLNQADRLVYGSGPEDVSLDAQPKYIAAMAKVCQLHQVHLHAGVRHFRTKLETVQAALELGVPIDLLHSARTDSMTGGCATSSKFLHAVQRLLPSQNPLWLLKRLSVLHLKRQSNPYDLTDLSELMYLSGRSEGRSWLLKQLLSRLPRPGSLRMPICLPKACPTVQKELRDLGYQNVAVGTVSEHLEHLCFVL